MARKRDGTARARTARDHTSDASAAAAREEARPLAPITGNPAIPIALDRVIHERMRLAIVSALAVHEVLTFNDLKAILETSDGNVAVHTRRLEEAGYLACTKGYDGRIPRTEYRLTPNGRDALARYLAHMEALIRSVEGS